mmetsp:Transcript_4547/g.9893  ORF Transcript_4547/g.9893 Transcript_4547/m.9893 type:complete len:246 (+) Transcript_4547:116-853(+)
MSADSGWQRRLVMAAPLVLIFSATIYGTNGKELLAAVVQQAEASKDEAPLVTMVLSILLVAVWILSFIPLTPIELALGYLLGVGPAYLVVFTGKVAGCLAAFLLGRTVARDWAQRTFGRHELLQALDLAVSERPFQICVIVRLAYIPIALKNYGLSLLAIQPKDYIAALLLVEVVMSFVLVTVGATAKDLGAMLSGTSPKSSWQLGAMALGALFLFTLIAYVSVATRRALQQIRAAKRDTDRKEL